VSQFLLLDAGNTTLKWWLVSAVAPGAKPSAPAVLAQGRLTWPRSDFLTSLRHALHATPIGRHVSGIGGCSVIAPDARQSLDVALLELTEQSPVWLESQSQFGADPWQLHNDYQVPASLGADRWHALLGAWIQAPGQTQLVVCAGTATTADALLANGHFAGGTITPGVALMHTSLSQQTAQLPADIGCHATFPVQTLDAIRTGIVDAQVGLILERHRHLAAVSADPVLVRLTGGHAPDLFSPLAQAAPHLRLCHDPDLILHGLWQRICQPARSSSC
jgi:type III pantothenate kinase